MPYSISLQSFVLFSLQPPRTGPTIAALCEATGSRLRRGYRRPTGETPRVVAAHQICQPPKADRLAARLPLALGIVERYQGLPGIQRPGSVSLRFLGSSSGQSPPYLAATHKKSMNNDKITIICYLLAI